MTGPTVAVRKACEEEQAQSEPQKRSEVVL